MRDCDSLGYLTPKQGMLSIRENSQHGSAVRLCLDFYKPDLYNAIHWQYSKGTAHCISSCRVSRELGSVGKKRSDLKINFKWAFLGRSFLLFYFNFFCLGSEMRSHKQWDLQNWGRCLTAGRPTSPLPCTSSGVFVTLGWTAAVLSQQKLKPTKRAIGLCRQEVMKKWLRTGWERRQAAAAVQAPSD